MLFKRIKELREDNDKSQKEKECWNIENSASFQHSNTH